MSLANPQALWLLLLVPIPLLLSKRRAERRRAVSNLFLWKASIEPDAPTLTVRSLRRRWLVALQMAIVAATVLALARPLIASRVARVALVFDLSASMNARDGSGTRLDTARTRAQSFVGALSRHSRVTLIAAGAHARDVGEYAASDAALSRAIAQLAPEAGASDISGALEIARRSSRVQRAVIFSDHSTTLATSELPVVWDTVGATADNLAISKLVARRRTPASSEGDVLAAVRNYGARPARADVEITQDGRLLDRRVVDIDKDGEATFVVGVRQMGGVFAARLAATDALDLDNARMDSVPPFERIRVALAGRKNFYVDNAIAADAALTVSAVPDAGDVIVCGCDQLPAVGNVLLLPDTARPLGAGLLAVVQQDHPVAADLRFAGAIARPTTGIARGDVVVRAGDAPAVVASERDGRRIVELRFIPAADSAISAGFPILIANAIRWLDGRQGNATQVNAGEPLRWMLPHAQTDASVTGPDGKTRTAQVTGRRLSVVDTAMPGVYTVRTAGAERRFAVNAVVDGESDLRTTGGVSLPSWLDGGEAATSERPLMRWLLLLAAVLVAIEWFVVRRRTWWRVATAACLLAAAAGLAVFPRTAPIDVVAVVDRSRSIPPRVQQDTLTRLTNAARTLSTGDRLGVVDVGADALVSAELSETASLHAAPAGVADSDTNIAAGLRLARAMLPPGGERRIVLFSDGRQTVGDAEREAAFLAANGVRVDVVPVVASSAAGKPVVTRVVAPAYARSNEPFDVSIEVEAAPDATARLTLYRDEQVVDTRSVRASASAMATETFTDKPPAGTHIYRASLGSDDADDAGAGAVVSVSGAPTALYVSRSAAVLEPVLASAGFHVSHVSPDAMPDGVDALSSYDSVVLDDVSADELGIGHASDLAQYVEHRGGGLLVLGGARTLDVAGYPIGPLGPVLPVDLRPRSGQRSPSFGLVLVFDKSGSMADQAGGTSKIELARQAVMRVLDVLPPTDSLGVIAFDASPVVVTRFGPGQRESDVGTQLNAIVPNGPTRIAPAASLATRWLNEADAKTTLARRQILLISDGQTSPDDEQQLRTAVAGAGVEVSAVAIGSSANRQLLQQLANSTGGRAYFPSDLTELPKIVAREAARSRSGHVVEEPFVLRAAAHPVTTGLERGSLPKLLGYVVGAAKPSAASILTSHLDDPILCAWQFGLGRVAVFTAGLESSWSAPLRAWRGSGRLWAQTARWVSRGLDDPELRIASRREGTTLQFVVDAAGERGRPLELTDIHATLRSPDEKTSGVAFDVAAPGHYVANVDATMAGAYTLSFDGRDRVSGIDHHLVSGVFRGDDQERTSSGSDDGLLGRLASMTGGRVVSASDNPFAGPRSTTYRDVSRWAAIAALMLYLANLLIGSASFTSSAAWTSRFPGKSRPQVQY